MNWARDIEGVDIYLIDQILKGRIRKGDRILDAGCGKGRNLRPFLENAFNCVGIDPDMEHIEYMKELYPAFESHFFQSSIESFEDKEGFDLIICNAVLHFAKDDAHFERMFSKLIELLKPGGRLFIRMTSNIGMDYNLYPTQGYYQLPDKSYRYLITRPQVDELLNNYGLQLLDPVKTTLVEDLRSMTTLMLEKP